jgi:hypothetical protein
MVPLKKQSKRSQREYHSAQRASWNGISPVTRIVASGKAYDRNRIKQENRRTEND